MPDAGSIPAISIIPKNIGYKINNQIKAREVRVIDDQGQNLGVMSLEEALRKAREKNLDLIEISVNANPPVTRIISFDKFRYQKAKELKKQKASRKDTELKQIRLSPRAAKNDLETKLKKLEEFLKEGHKVEIDLVLKGRERANKGWALKKLEEFLQSIKIPYKTTMEPKLFGRKFIAQIVKKEE